MTSITLRGDQYDINFFEVGIKEFQILTGMIPERSEYTKLWSELIDKLLSFRRINGFSYDEEGFRIAIEVDGKDLTETEIFNLPVQRRNYDASDRSVVSSKAKPEDHSYTLFSESRNKGSSTLEIEDYDPTKLSLSIENQTLPDGSIRSVVIPCYCGVRFDTYHYDEIVSIGYEGIEEYVTTPNGDRYGQYIYIITPDGDRLDLATN